MPSSPEPRPRAPWGRLALAILLGGAAGTAPGGTSLAVRGGNPARVGEWPAVAALVDRGTKGVGIFGAELKGVYCTGTLVHPRVVLTAAHCVVDPRTDAARTDLARNLSIYLGEGRLNHRGAVQGQVRALRAVLHPDSTKGVDLALLALERSVDRPAPTLVHELTLPGGARVLSVGFGETGCGGKLNTMGRKSSAQRRLDLAQPGLLCSDRSRTRLPSSGGDSGGPALLRIRDGRSALAAVLSGFRTLSVKGRQVEADCWIPVHPHLAWIRKGIADLAGR